MKTSIQNFNWMDWKEYIYIYIQRERERERVDTKPNKLKVSNWIPCGIYGIVRVIYSTYMFDILRRISFGLPQVALVIKMYIHKRIRYGFSSPIMVKWCSSQYWHTKIVTSLRYLRIKWCDKHIHFPRSFHVFTK